MIPSDRMRALEFCLFIRSDEGIEILFVYHVTEFSSVSS
jgi:hypothetical protein